MKKVSTFLKKAATILAAICVVVTTATNAFADKLHLKDGRVLDGVITSETADYVYFKTKIGGIESTDIYAMTDIKKIERDAVTNPKPSDEKATTDKPADTASAKPATKGGKDDGVHRVCILNYGPPSTWSNEAGNMVGVQISAAAFERAVPLLEKDGVTDVVIRINSGGGYSIEMEKFQDLFENVYKKKFRTVAWIESAISAACMSPWVIEEFYFLPKGNMGACTEFSGAFNASKGLKLEMVLMRMEEASKKANRDPKIMRAMQIQEPLSASIDPVTGKVTWYQDATSGDKVINPPGHVLTINAEDAFRFKLCKAICATKEELAEAMLGKGVEYVFAGKEAADSIDQSIRTNDRAEKDAVEVAVKYVLALQLAASAQDREERAAQVGRAKKFLNQLESWVKQNPNLEFHLANQVGALLDKEWFILQRERLKDLLR